jgi:hypothetical protein
MSLKLVVTIPTLSENTKTRSVDARRVRSAHTDA